jgi:probable addiction module antidote protein
LAIEVRQTEEFRVWLRGLRDRQAKTRITARIRRLEQGNPGDAKSVGGVGGSTVMTKTTRFDAAEYLDTPELQAAYISAALETGDPAFVRDAIGLVARARGMSEIARAAGLNRESLYKALGETGNPEFGTMLGVLRALGLQLAARPIKGKASRHRTRKAA